METLGIDKLPPEARVQLADEIMEKIDCERGLPPLTDEHRKALGWRIQEIDSASLDASVLEEIRSRVLAHVSR